MRLTCLEIPSSPAVVTRRGPPHRNDRTGKTPIEPIQNKFITSGLENTFCPVTEPSESTASVSLERPHLRSTAQT